MNLIIQKFLTYASNNTPRLLTGLVILIFTWIIAVILQRAILRFSKKLDSQRKQVATLATSVCKATIIILGILSALGTIGINVTALVASLGLTGFALGFALKDALSNLLSGILIIVYRPFRYGDTISVAGCEGEVVEINLRYTVIKNNINQKHLIPNSVLFNNTIRLSEKNN